MASSRSGPAAAPGGGGGELVQLRRSHHRSAPERQVQTQQRLELIVVDDASTDDGTAVVERWIDDCLSTAGHPFVRVLLLRHGQNAGLAVARNTALAHSQAPWCFVLDADNALFPDAVAGCLALADASDPNLAVVHPLLAVEAEPGRLDEQRTLVRSSELGSVNGFGRENDVDAMALVRAAPGRRSGDTPTSKAAGRTTTSGASSRGGLSRAPMPRILAVYRSHAASMSHCATNRSWHALSRTLQQRHPWLQLPLGADGDRSA